MILTCTTAISDRLRRAAAIFGLSLRRARTAHPGESHHRVARAIDESLHPGEIALITGASGSGKSSILRALSRLPGATMAPRTFAPKPVADLFRAGLSPMMRLLAAAGLADATILARLPHQLSEGERARLSLALALDRRRASTILIDEFASTLDRPGAQRLARSLRRWLRRRAARTPRPPRIIVATAHTDVAAHLRPDLVVRPDAPALRIRGDGP